MSSSHTVQRALPVVTAWLDFYFFYFFAITTSNNFLYIPVIFKKLKTFNYLHQQNWPSFKDRKFKVNNSFIGTQNKNKWKMGLLRKMEPFDFVTPLFRFIQPALISQLKTKQTLEKCVKNIPKFIVDLPNIFEILFTLFAGNFKIVIQQCQPRCRMWIVIRRNIAFYTVYVKFVL